MNASSGLPPHYRPQPRRPLHQHIEWTPVFVAGGVLGVLILVIVISVGYVLTNFGVG